MSHGGGGKITRIGWHDSCDCCSVLAVQTKLINIKTKDK